MSLNESAPPVALTIAGSDSSAGAGIQADLKTFHTYQVYGLTAITGIVAESPIAVKSWQATSPELLCDQLSCLLESYPISAIKVGALFTPDLVQAVQSALTGFKAPLIVDPVGTASTGAHLGGSGLIASLGAHLLPKAYLITPNLKEAQLLSGNNSTDLRELGIDLAKKYQTNILVKGGHAEGDQAIDLLVKPSLEVTPFSLPRISAPDYHGTGCTLSAAIASEIALGASLESSICNAKKFLHNAISTAHHWDNVTALNTFRNS